MPIFAQKKAFSLENDKRQEKEILQRERSHLARDFDLKKVKANFKSNDEDERLNAVEIAGYFPESNLTDDVENLLLTDKSPEVRQQSARTLRMIGDKKAISALISALKDEDKDVKIYSALALANLGEKEQCMAVANELWNKGQNDNLWWYCHSIFRDIATTEAINNLAYDLNDTDKNIAASAAICLAQIGQTEKAFPFLQQSLNNSDKYIRMAALSGLAYIWDNASLELIKSCINDENILVRDRAIGILQDNNINVSNYSLRATTAYSYNTQDAIAYASCWCNRRNTAYYKDWSFGDNSDCANFVSQCLIAGGLNLQNIKRDYDNNGDYFFSYGCIVRCVELWNLLNKFPNADYLGERTTATYPSGFTKGDVVIWYHPTLKRWRHTAITGSSSTSNSIYAHDTNYCGVNMYMGGFSKAGFYHISSATNTLPTITTPNYGDVFRVGETVPVYVGEYNGNWNNIRVRYQILLGEPAFHDNESNSNDLIANHRAGTNYFDWTISTNSVWLNKWVKIFAENTATGQKSAPQYIRVVPAGTSLIPTISSPSASCTSNAPSYHVGEQVNVTLNGFTGILADWNSRTKVIYAILTGTPQCHQWDENIYQNSSVNNGEPCKFTAYESESGETGGTPNTYFFTPENRSAWEGRWCKIIAQNLYGGWSEQRYIKITPTLATLSVGSYTLSPSFNPNTTNYTTNVANSVTSINISATANSTAIQPITGTGNKSLNVGNNTYNITVTGNNGASKTYIVTVNRVGETCKTPPDYDLSFTPDETWSSKDWGASINSSSDCKVYKINGVSGAIYDLHIDPRGSFDPVLILYDRSGNQIGNILDAGGSGGVEYHEYQFTDTHIYAKVKGWSSSVGQFDFSCRKVPLSADAYEPNNSQSEASNLSVNFSNNSATVNANANFHTSSDVDYYKIELPSGYNYTVTPRLHDSYSSGNGQTYTVDAKFSYLLNSGSWSTTYDTSCSAFNVTNGGTLYFKVEPYFSGNMGTYLLAVNITRVPITYNISIGTFANGSVSTNKTTAAQGETVTLTISPASCYELESILATGVALNGTGNTRTFTMPAHDVTVTATFKKTQACIDAEAVAAAKIAIESGNYTVTQEMANTELTVKTWLASQINSLIASTGVTVSPNNISITGFSAASGGINGSFNFTVSLTKGTATGSASKINNVISAIPVYNVQIAAVMTNGSVSASKTANITAGETISLNISPSAGYELETISAYRTGTPSTIVTLNGSGNARTFTMPAYGVTVTATFKKTQDQIDKEAIEAVKSAVEGGSYRIAQATGNTEADVKTWLVATLNELYSQAYGVQFRSTNSVITGDVEITAITPAIAGTANIREGINGSFKYTVTLSKNNVTLKTSEVSGVIVATSYTTIHITGISLDNKTVSLLVDATEQLTATIFPENATNKKIMWSSNNSNVATVTDGLITAISAGIATITATTEDGNFTATCKVTVEGANSINEIAANQLQIFPNPVKEEIFIKSDLPIDKVEIYSLTGTLLFSESNFSEKISVSALSKGIYLLKVYTDKGVAVSKIVKE